MRLMALLLLILLIPTASAVVIERGEVLYKPKVSSVTPFTTVYYSQDVKNHTLTFTSPYDFPIYDVRVNSTLIGNLKPHDVLTKTVEGGFNVRIKSVVKGNSSRFVVKYTVYNDYNCNITVKIQMSRPGWLIDCKNCSMNGSVVFQADIPPNSSKSFELVGSGNAEIPNAVVEINSTRQVNITFTVPLIVSITKTNIDNDWFAKFNVYNPTDITVRAKITGFVNKSQPPHMPAEVIFVDNITLQPYGCWNKTVTIKSDSAGFFLKCEGNVRAEEPMQVLVKGELFGFKIVFPSSTNTGGGGGGMVIPQQPQKQEEQKQEQEVQKEEAVKETGQQRGESSSGRSSGITENIPLIFPVVISNVVKSITPKSVKVVKVVKVVRVGKLNINVVKLKKKDAVVISTYVALIPSLAMLIPPLLRFRPDVVDRAEFSLSEVFMFRRIVYIPVKCKIGRILPGGVTFVVPNEELARDIHERFDIPLRSAEAIAIAIEQNCRVFLSDRRAYEVALSLGLDAHYLPPKTS